MFDIVHHLRVLFIIVLTGWILSTGDGFLFGRWCLGAHQEYLSCGSACPLLCNDVRTARYNKLCTYQCVQGCFCKRGYARETHPKSTCIPDWRC